MIETMFDRDPWYKEMMPDFRELSSSEIPPGQASGCEFTSVCLNLAIYLPWLVGQCLRNGVVFKRAVLSHISEARTMSHTGQAADFIINTTGLGSRKLGGVEDTALAPARGQTVIVRNEFSPMVALSGSDDGPAEICYLMQRAAGGGTVLGGTYDVGNWESAPDPNIAVRIMRRVVEACPGIVADGQGIEGLSVVRHAVGLRPWRQGGLRLEEERLGDGGGAWVVHNYGHAGWGYQGSYGCAEGVVELVNKIRKDKGESLDDEPKLFSWE